MFYEYRNRHFRKEKTISIFVRKDGSIEADDFNYQQVLRFILDKIPKAPDLAVPDEYKKALNVAWFLHYEAGMSVYPVIPEAQFPKKEDNLAARSETLTNELKKISKFG